MSKHGYLPLNVIDVSTPMLPWMPTIHG